MKPQFFCAKYTASYAIATIDGIKTAWGKPAAIPALPNLRFCYTERPNEHLLTECRTGRVFAKAPSRKDLHNKVYSLLTTQGPTWLLTEIAKTPPVYLMDKIAA